jgi:hypothetical protein
MNTIAKSDVVDQVNSLFEEAIRAKIDQWTDQCLLHFIEWAQGNPAYLAFKSPQDVLDYFKRNG